jgi:hypothetical protein
LDYQSNAGLVTKVINSLTDTESIQSDNVIMHPIMNTIQTVAKSRANAHAIYMAGVSHKLVISAAKRPAFNQIKRQVDEYLSTADADDSPDAQPYTLSELRLALKKYITTVQPATILYMQRPYTHSTNQHYVSFSNLQIVYGNQANNQVLSGALSFCHF